MNQQELRDYNNRYINTNADGVIKGSQLNYFNDNLIGHLFSGATDYGWTSGQTVSYLEDNYYTSGQTDQLISSELSSRVSVDMSLSTSISTEKSDRIVGDQSLSNAIAATDVTSLSTILQTEISDRVSVDNSLSTSIVNIPIYDDSSLSISISVETSNRESVDNSLSSSIVNIPIYDDSSISTAVVNEVSSRESGDISLSSSIVSEISVRGSVDVSLATSALQPWIDINRCGFVNNNETTINFNSGTSVFTLSGSSWSYYRAGLKHTITGSKSITIPTTTNTYFITINSTDGTLISGVTPWTLMDAVIPVVTITYNSSFNPTFLMADERHTVLIDRRIHLYEHQTNGTQFISGGLLSGPDVTPAVPTNYNNTFGVGVTTIADEDLYLNLPAFNRPSGVTNSYLHLIRSGLTSWTWDLKPMPYTSGGTGYINYDLNGVLTVGRDARWYNMYLLFDNVKDQPMGLIHGRGEFTSLLLAQAESPLTFSLTNLPVVESIVAYQFTFNTNNSHGNSGRCRLAVSPKLINIAATSIIGSGAGTDHNTLAGLQGGAVNEMYHLNNTDYLNVTGLTTTLSTLTSVDTSLSSSISTLTSTDVVLSTSISSVSSSVVSGDNSLSSSISSVSSTRLSVDTSLSSSISTISGVTLWTSTDLSTILGDGQLLMKSGSTLSGYTNLDSSLSTSITTKADKFLTFVTTGSSYTLQSTDNNKVFHFNDTLTLTLPSGLTSGFQVVVMNVGSSKTITLSTSGTLYTKGGLTTITSQYGAVSVYFDGTSWYGVGDLA